MRTISLYLFKRKKEYIDIELETEDGLMNIDDYIDYIKRDGILGGNWKNMLHKNYII